MSSVALFSVLLNPYCHREISLYDTQLHCVGACVHDSISLAPGVIVVGKLSEYADEHNRLLRTIKSESTPPPFDDS